MIMHHIYQNLISYDFLSFQQQYAYVVIQALMSHLDAHVRDSPDVKAAIVEVLFESVLIAAGASIGKPHIQ